MTMAWKEQLEEGNCHEALWTLWHHILRMNLTIGKLYFFLYLQTHDILRMEIPRWLLYPSGYQIGRLSAD